jgi:hypothetical protein
MSEAVLENDTKKDRRTVDVTTWTVTSHMSYQQIHSTGQLGHPSVGVGDLQINSIQLETVEFQTG